MDNDYKNGNATNKEALRVSELSYRRLFEAAKDGILILNAETGRITDVNPFLFNLLGFSRIEMIGKTVGELSPFQDIEPNQNMLERLQQFGYVRYEDLPLETRDGRHIVHQVLSFARGLEGQKIEVQPKHLLNDLKKIIKDTFPKDIRLQFCIPDDTWTILGDPTQVQQILLNLCVNARDAMPHGGSLMISIENCVLGEQYSAMNLQAKAGRYVNICVSDSGTGIPRDILDKIFEPFFTTKEINAGTGLS